MPIRSRATSVALLAATVATILVLVATAGILTHPTSDPRADPTAGGLGRQPRPSDASAAPGVRREAFARIPLPTRPPLADLDAEIRPAPTPVPTTAPDANDPASEVAGTTVTGIASNYPGTAGWIGQATVALPGALGGRYNGEVNGHVTVCADRCATLPVVDWCQCYWGTDDQRIVDLSHPAWELISDAPLAEGLIEVRLTVGG